MKDLAVYNLEEPMPKESNNVCLVCKENYKDYFEHINSKAHKKIVREDELYL